MTEPFRRIPVADVTSPHQTGILQSYRDYWWSVDANDCVLLYGKTGSPQCNMNRLIVERYKEPGTRAVLLPWAWLPINLGDYT